MSNKNAGDYSQPPHVLAFMTASIYNTVSCLCPLPWHMKWKEICFNASWPLHWHEILISAKGNGFQKHHSLTVISLSCKFVYCQPVTRCTYQCWNLIMKLNELCLPVTLFLLPWQAKHFVFSFCLCSSTTKVIHLLVETIVYLFTYAVINCPLNC